MTAFATIAVLDDDPEVGQILWKAGGGSGRLHRQYHGIQELFYLAELAGVYQLWISDRWLKQHHPQCANHGCTRHPLTPEKAWHLAPIEDERQQLAIVFPSVDKRLEAFTRVDGQQLLSALVMLERELGTWFTASPGRTAEAMIRADLRRRGLHNVAELPPILTERSRKPVEAPFAWIRPLTADEAAMPYLVAVDKHAAYLTAMGHLELGVGELEHRVFRENAGEMMFDRKLPGYWLVRTKPVRGVHTIPDPTRARGGIRRREDPDALRWLTTPSVRAADETGILLNVEEAYVWRKHTRPLAWFADRLRHARGHLSFETGPARAVAETVVKRLYASMIGRLRMHRESGPDPLFRPDWHDQLVAEARVNLFFNVWNRTAAQPAAAAIDCWYFPSPAREPPAGLRYGDDAGEYSVKAVVPLAAVREIFDTRHVRVLADRVAQLASGPCRFCSSPGSDGECCFGGR